MCSKSGKGFVFTLEAGIALLCFFVFLSALHSISFEDYSDVVLYKEASDYAQIAMKKHCEYDEDCKWELVEKLGRESTGDKCAVVVRTTVTKDLRYEPIEFELCA